MEPNFKCQYGEDTRTLIDNLKEDTKGDLIEIKELIRKLGESIELLKNRLPIWATLYISLLSAVVAGLIIASVK